MTLMSLRRSLGQRSRSRSASDGRGNFVNANAPELLNGFEPKLAKTFPIVRPQTDWVFSVP